MAFPPKKKPGPMDIANGIAKMANTVAAKKAKPPEAPQLVDPTEPDADDMKPAKKHVAPKKK